MSNVPTFEEYFNENRLSPYIAAGLSMLPGAPGATQADAAPQQQAAEQQYPTVQERQAMGWLDRFMYDWGEYYQTDKNISKVEAARERLMSVINSGKYVDLNDNIRNSISRAGAIFDGDEGATAKELRIYLLFTGWIESGYRTTVQVGGPARSYWQVEPETAHSLVTNSAAYFGSKFEKHFSKILGPNVLKQLQSYSLEDWSHLLENNDDMGAAMAAAKWIASKYHVEN